MPVNINKDQCKNIIEIWGYGTNTIIVHTVNGRCIKITAAHNIKSNTTINYYAFYEERQELEITGKNVEVWVKASFPWQTGDTVEHCLKMALFSVDEEG